MALAFADRVKETTTTTGTGTITLAGASAGYQSFAAIGNGNTTYYTIAAGSQWEVGIGTYTAAGTTLSRDTVLASSSGGALVNFSAGVKDVFCDYPAGKAVIQDGASIAAGTAILGVPNGGTGAATLTTNGVLYGNGTSALAVTAAGTSGQVLVGNTGGAPSWASLSGIGVTSFSAGTTGLTPSTGTTGAITLAGTLGVANGGTGATTLSSGYLVKGNGTSAVSASVIFDNGTNVGIGTSSPSSRLTVQGDELIIPAAGWTSGQAARLYLGDTNNGIQSVNGAYQNYFAFNGHSWLISGSERMRIDSSGNVGIATSSPATPLDVGGTIRTSTGGSDPGTGTALYFVGSGAFQSVLAGAAFAVHTGNNNARTERMRVDISGNVGIGTSSPGAKLDVTTASGANIVVSRSSAAGYAAFQRIAPAGQQTYDFYTINGTEAGRITVDGSNFMAFSTGSSATERMRIDSSGNVGIGISSPSYRLDVGTGTAVGTTAGNSISVSRLSGGAGTNNVALQTTLNRISNGTDWQTTALRVQAQVDLTPFGYIDFLNGSSAAMAFGRATSEFMRIDSSGNLGLGTTAPTVQFQINGTQPQIQWSNPTTGATSNDGTHLYLSSSDFWLVNKEAAAMVFATSNTERARITSAGDVGIGTTSPGATLTVVTNTTSHNGMRVTNNSTTQFAGSGLQMLGPSAAGSQGGAGIYYYNTNVGGTTGGLGIAQLNSSGNFQRNLAYYDYNSQFWGFLTNGSERIRIDSSGNVGIGTSSPGARLDVNGTSTTDIFHVTRGTTWFTVGVTDGSRVDVNAFQSGVGARHLALQSAGGSASFEGNLGIGTSSPGVRLDVVGGSIRVGNTHAMTFRNAAGTGTATYTLQSDDNFVVYNAAGTPIQSFSQGAAAFAVYGGNANNRMIVDSGSNITYWIVNGSERARINSSGEFLVGTSSGGRTVCINASDNWVRQVNPSRSWLIGMGTGSNFNIFDETGGGTRLGIDTSGNWLGTNSIILGAGFNNDNRIEVGQGRTGNNFAYIDLIGDTTYTDYGLRLLRGNGGPNATSELNHRGTGPFSINVQDAGILALATSNTERMRIDSAGSVGLGTSSPQCRFNVKGGTTWLQNFNGANASPTEAVDWPVPALNVTSFGDFTLQTMMTFTLPNDGNYFTGDNVWNFRLEQTASSTTSAGVAGMRFMGPGYLLFGPGQSERMRIDASGHARFGPYASSSSSGNATGVEIMNNGGTGDSNLAAMSFHCQGTYGMHLGLRPDGYFGAGGWSASSWRWYVYMPSGDMTAAGNVTAYSDPRLKEDVQPITGALATLGKLDGVRFRWKQQEFLGHAGEYDYGVLADQVQAVLPEIVADSMHDAPEGGKYKTVAYDKLVPLLIEAVKELTARVAELERK